MQVKNKKLKCGMFGASLWLLSLILLIRLYPSPYDEVKKEAADEFKMSVSGVFQYNPANRGLNTIDWWQDSYDGTYYFFLPSSADCNKLTLKLLGAESIYLGEEYVEDGEEFSVSPKEYMVKVPSRREEFRVVFLQSSNLPSLYLSTEEDGEEKFDLIQEEKGTSTEADMLLADETGRIVYRGELEYIRGRGNVTWEESGKKGYQMKLENKADLLELGEAKRWILLPNSFDRSNLKNYLAYRLAGRINLPFTPEVAFIDWYVDGEYQGIYLLSEKVEIDPERIAIKDLEKETEKVNDGLLLEEFEYYQNGNNGDSYTSKGYLIPNNPKDITGGYLLELELRGRYEIEPCGFVTPNQEELAIASPKFASQEQVNYISTYYEETEAAFLAPDGIHPLTGKAFTDYLDVESFSKKYIMEELTKNVDAGLSSQYLFKLPDDMGGKLFAGPPWDYDTAWGTGGERYGVELSDPVGFYANMLTEESILWNSLYAQPVFYYYVCYFYQNEVLPALRDETTVWLDQYADRIEDSVVMNYYRWNIAEEESVEEKKETFRGRVESVKDFANKRSEFLEDNWKIAAGS